jgi:putative NIF3 family GTP cyclohydrolase 1 type 2
MTARDVVARIQAGLHGWKESPLDVFGAGNPDTAVRGIATTFAPSLQVLRQAAAGGFNMIIARENVFHIHRRMPPPAMERVANTPAAIVKRDLIAKENLVVWRLMENWDTQRPEPQLRGLAKALGWEKRVKPSKIMPFHTTVEYFLLPPDTLGSLAASIHKNLKLSGIRVTGDPGVKVGTVALTHGLLNVPELRRIMAFSGVDAVVTGEPVEWEATPYMQDAIASGRKCGMISIGQQASEEPGAGEMAAWLKTLIPELPVKWIPSSEPFWAPPPDAGKGKSK